MKKAEQHRYIWLSGVRELEGLVNCLLSKLCPSELEVYITLGISISKGSSTGEP